MSTLFDRLVHTSSQGGGIARVIASPAGTVAKTMEPRRKSMTVHAAAMKMPNKQARRAQSRGTGFE